jgi:hypothetical protein
MGKRELLLIVGFAMLATVLYVATAPESPAGGVGDSFGKLFENIRREVRGNQASTEMTTNATHPLTSAISEIRVNIRTAQITIAGEDRADVASELFVWSNGYDEAQAKSLAAQTVLKVETAGPAMLVTIGFPQPGTQRARLTLRVPSRMRIQFVETTGRLEVSNVAAVQHEMARGETTVRQIPGKVNVTHRGGKLTVTDVGPVRLNVRGSDLELSGVKGETVLQVQSGDVRAGDLLGSIEVESQSADIILERFQKSRDPLRIVATGGKVTVRGLRTEARIEGRDAEIEVAVDQAAPLAIFNSNERVEIVPPAGGYTLDAVSSHGEIVLPDDLKKTIEFQDLPAENEQRASGKINGGGPIITVRNSRADIRLSPPAAPAENR